MLNLTSDFFFRNQQSNLTADRRFMAKKIYFAGPLFSQGEWEWNKRLAQKLRKDFTVILPQEAAEPMLKGKQTFDAHALFAANIRGIDEADVVVAILDQADPDSGTCWECGYAYAIKRPIIGVRTDIRRASDDPHGSVNLMLTQSAKRFILVEFKDLDDEGQLAAKILAAINSIVP
jgi:nucleoside 2-deoxyribosyltransferase